MFQSTYLYKVRQYSQSSLCSVFCFNPRTYIRYDVFTLSKNNGIFSFNPRTYIRYDGRTRLCISFPNRFNPRTYIRYDQQILKYFHIKMFQSTYLYKVRHCPGSFNGGNNEFQSTYLYKVRHWFYNGSGGVHVSIHVPI